MITLEQYKQQATALEIEAANAGHPVKRCDALEQVAKRAGFHSWRALIASKSTPLSNHQAEPPPLSSEPTPKEPEHQTYSLRRNGAPPLKFSGRLLAEYNADFEERKNGWDIYYAIYVTKKGKYIAYRYYGHNSQPARRDTEDAESMSLPEDVVDWFRDDKGELCHTSQLLLERASRNDNGIKEAYCENVD